ncbi:MAG: MBL fold metallo-hydrolase [Oscillospiraceae bacterium]|nr:MBL fold metallo-hydrolase [Oscillospiraceae bacterium]MDY2509896.1 MBL fold metallo-hydrolase [Ruminococcus callidus]
MAQITKWMVGALAVNCYVIVTEKKHVVAVDVGGDAQKILQYLKENDLQLTKILLTHGHYDHIGGVAELQATTGATVYIHEADAPMLSDNMLNLAQWIVGHAVPPVTDYKVLQDGDEIVQDECTFHVLHTPGHTKGSVCYQLEHTLFTGDTLFRLSRGRTDFPGGSDDELYASLQRLKQLDGEYDVLPGHNETSTLSYERQHNPNLR